MSGGHHVSPENPPICADLLQMLRCSVCRAVRHVGRSCCLPRAPPDPAKTHAGGGAAAAHMETAAAEEPASRRSGRRGEQSLRAQPMTSSIFKGRGDASAVETQRRGRDSNPRSALTDSGFQELRGSHPNHAAKQALHVARRPHGKRQGNDPGLTLSPPRSPQPGNRQAAVPPPARSRASNGRSDRT
jgi:hypothetical protein